MGVRKMSSGIRTRVEEAWKRKDWGELASLLDDATGDAIAALKPVIPDLSLHHDWIVRASAVEAIGRAHLQSFVNVIKARLQDRNRVVRSYALMAYYDLLGAKALPVINALCAVEDVRVRVTALALRYVHTREAKALAGLRGILMRKNCNYFHRSAVLEIFNYYFDGRPPAGVVRLFKDVLLSVPKSSGLGKDIKKALTNWAAAR